MSDLTIADFWGIDEIAPEMNDHKGNSLIIIRNSKASDIFDSIKDSLTYKEVNFDVAVKYYPAEYSSCMKPKEREYFFDDLRTLNIEEMNKKYLKLNFWEKVRSKLFLIKHKDIK